MGILNLLLRFIEPIFDIEINQNEQLIQSFLAKAPYSLSLAIVAIISTAAIYLIIIQLIKFIKTIQENKISKLRILFFITLSSVIISSFIVHGIKEVNAEKPVFIDDNDEPINEKLIFINEVPSFRWKFDEDRKIENNLKDDDKDLVYKVKYIYKEKNDKDFHIETKKSAEFETMPTGNIYWQVIPGFCKNNDLSKCNSKTTNNFVPISKFNFNNSDFLKISYYPNLFEKIKDQKAFRVLTTGVTNRGYFSFKKDGRTQGFDYLLASEIKQQLFPNAPNIKIEFEEEPWGKIFSLMEDGKIADIAINTISKTQEREDKYGIKFSEPYQENITLSLMISKRKLDSINKNDDILHIIAGKKIGVLNNSTAHITLKEFNKILKSDKIEEIKIIEKKSSQKTINDLIKDKIDFILVDTPYVEGINLNPSYKNQVKSFIELVPELYPDRFPKTMIGEDYSIVINPEHVDFYDELNKAIKKIKDDGLISQIESSSIKLYKDKFFDGKKCLTSGKNRDEDNSYCNN